VVSETAAVLDPRPETETLVELALRGGRAARVLDIGTGSGAILLTLLAEWPSAQGVGTDVDPAALALAGANADRLGVAARLRLMRTDWAEGVDGRFDLVVSNPPYIAAGEIDALAPDVRAWEPRHALTPGPTGLESYACIAPALPETEALQGVVNELARAVREHRAPQTDGAAGVRVVRILEAAGRSIDAGGAAVPLQHDGVTTPEKVAT